MNARRLFLVVKYPLHCCMDLGFTHTPFFGNWLSRRSCCWGSGMIDHKGYFFHKNDIQEWSLAFYEVWRRVRWGISEIHMLEKVGVSWQESRLRDILGCIYRIIA